MVLENLRLSDFRNHRNTAIAPDAGTNLILGKNAQGKTNLLEAIYYLSRGHSFRTRGNADLIRFGTDTSQLDAAIQRGDGDHCEMTLRFGVQRLTTVNGVKKKKAAEYSGLFHVVLFCPEDLQIIQGAPAVRRQFMDSALCQLRPLYATYLSEYNRLHAHITRILRDGSESLSKTLDDFSYRLYSVGARLIPYRAAFCTSLSENAFRFHRDIADGEALSIGYHTVSTVTDPETSVVEIGRQLWEHYLSHKDASQRAGMILTGPHRDDIAITVGGQSTAYVSQGQARTAALSCKLAEREIFTKNDRTAPILLLDDVLSELDAARRAYILRGITGGQVFITACDVGCPDISVQKVFTVLEGQVTEQNL